MNLVKYLINDYEIFYAHKNNLKIINLKREIGINHCYEKVEKIHLLALL